MRLTLLHNPNAGEEDHSRDHLEALLERSGHDVTYHSFEDDDWHEALDGRGDLIVVAGGDGSVRKLFTAIGPSRTVAAVLPLGSANNIARTLGLDLERTAALLAREGGEPRSFDVWDVTSTWGASRCVEAVGGGLFAQILAKAAETSSEPSGQENVDFGLELLAEKLAAAEARPWTVELDGVRTEEDLIGLEAMNIREIGAHLSFAPEADPGDGRLDVVFVRPEDRDALFDYVQARLRDEQAEFPSLPTRRAGHVVLEPPGDVRLHVDDALPAWDLSFTSWVEATRADVQLDVLAESLGTR